MCIRDRYKDRAGGFTRVLQTGQRKSDSARMAYVEYVDREGELRPARPASGFGLSWAAKEYVQNQLRNGGGAGEREGTAESAAADGR